MRVVPNLTCSLTLLVLLVLSSCKRETSTPKSSTQQENPPLTAGESVLTTADVEKLRSELKKWHSSADEDAVWIRGFKEQNFLLSKSKIVAVEDGQKLQFAPDPTQARAGIIFLMPQGKWCKSFDELVTTIQKASVQQDGYMKSAYHLTPLEQLSEPYK